MKKFIFLVFVFASQQLSAQSLPEEYEAVMDELSYISNPQKFEKIEAAFTSKPNDPWHYWMKAEVYAEMNDDKNTRLNYEKSIQLDANFSAGYGSYGRYLLAQDTLNFKRVIELSSKAIELAPREIIYRIDRAQAYYYAKNYESALTDAEVFNKYLGDELLDGELMALRCLHALGRQEELTKRMSTLELSQMLVEPKDALFLASVYSAQGMKEKACTCYRLAAESYDFFSEEVPTKVLEQIKKCE
jgi:tetratricopeptide (TPR) repeat protein